VTLKDKGQGHKLTSSETKCCTCVTRGGRGHTVSAEPGGHISCFGTNEKKTDAEISEELAGFRIGRGTRDHITYLRVLMEKVQEHQ